jgi:hypothetical protein
MNQFISRQTLALGLIKYDGATRAEAFSVLCWKCSDEALSSLNNAQDPFTSEIGDLPLVENNTPFVVALARAFGLKLAVIDLIFRKGL